MQYFLIKQTTIILTDLKINLLNKHFIVIKINSIATSVLKNWRVKKTCTNLIKNNILLVAFSIECFKLIYVFFRQIFQYPA